MADKFFQDTDSPPLEDKIKVGENEYSFDEINKLISLGKIAQDVETRYNTKIDRVYPEFTKATQKIKDLEQGQAELEALKAQIASAQSQQQGGWSDEQKALARQQLKDLLGGEPMTQTQLEDWYQSRRGGEKLLEDCQRYADEIDGSDGRPKFDADTILAHMKDTGIINPFKAYKDKYETELDDWKTKQLQSERKPGMFTNTQTTGVKEPREVRPTKDNINQLIAEVLNENREQV